MKKIILLSILFIFLIGNINAQDSTKVELTKETIYKDVKNALSQLGDALKVGAEHVYEILVKQQVANSIINLSLYVVLIITTFVIGKLFFKYYNYTLDSNHPWYNDDLEDHCVLWLGLVGFLVSIVGTIILIIGTISETITGFINPEYGAIKEIMELIK